MRNKYFTIIELLVAIGVMMILASALSYTYTTTANVASGQMASADVNAKANYILNSIATDLNGLRTRGEFNDNNVQMVGKLITIDQPSMKIGGTETPFLGFVTSFVEADYVENVRNKEKVNGVIYDGVDTGDFRNTEGMKEVAYYSALDQDTGFYNVYKAIRAPVGTGMLNDNGAGLSTEDYLDAYIISKNIIHLGFSYYDGGASEFTCNASDGVDYPLSVDVVVSMAATTGPGQWEGEIVRFGATSIEVKWVQGAFPNECDETDIVGYMMIDNGVNGNVFGYKKVVIDRKAEHNGEDIIKYTFTGEKAQGVPNVSGSEGDSVILGQTFKRSYVIR